MGPRRSAMQTFVTPKFTSVIFAGLQLLSTAPFKILNSNKLLGLKFWFLLLKDAETGVIISFLVQKVNLLAKKNCGL